MCGANWGLPEFVESSRVQDATRIWIKPQECFDPLQVGGTWLATVRFPSPRRFNAYVQFPGAFLAVFLHLNTLLDDLLANASRGFGC